MTDDQATYSARPRPYAELIQHFGGWTGDELRWAPQHYRPDGTLLHVLPVVKCPYCEVSDAG